ncbi:uncharacterized protein [Cicer arietinum]|uniref:uncharacterized protein n=1 Tax=Cicer arietinum TaxID=3827 RepID=UPI00032A80BC
METKKNLYFKKNDGKRIIVRCEPKCPFYMRISKRTSNEYWQLVSFTDDHTCHRRAKNRQAETEWLTKKFVPMLRHTPKMKPKGLIVETLDKWGVKLSTYQAYRAKVRAIEMIQGAQMEQYAHLREYADELRPLIGLDACFLKAEYGGQLIAAVGKDGNNQMILIAYAVVEVEIKDSWQWFLDLLLEDLNNVQHKQYAFISDQQKQFVLCNLDWYLPLPTLGPMWNTDYVLNTCMGIGKKKYHGGHMKELLWLAARATVVQDCEKAMQKIKTINEDAWKDMMQLPPSMWTRSTFRTDTQCDLQVNSMCEAFNMVVLEYRDKPIITLLEGLKHYITVRIVKQKELMLRYRGNICPRIQQILEKAKRAVGGWFPTWHGDDDFNLFSVTNGVDTYTVNLHTKTCACRKWDLTGIPCCHALV